MTEQPLVGGWDPAYAPVRVGDTVRRHPTPFSEAVRALLLHLEQVGFEEAPRWLGIDERGRHVLSYIEGDVPLPPYPGWAMTDRALADLGALVCRLHEATRSFDQSSVAGWAGLWADPDGGPVICHNDLFPENVVFRDGRVVALIDFEMAAPGRPLWDLAIAAEVWCPLGDPARRTLHPTELDGIGRLGLVAAGYGLPPGQATELVDVVLVERERAHAYMRAEVAAGNSTWITTWQEMGGDERAAADDAWFAAHRHALIAAAAGEG